MNRHATVAPAEAPVDLATATLGLPGFVVLAAAEYGGELELLVETTESVTGCPRCGVVATLHDRKPRYVRDLPSGGRPVVLVWFKRIWRCEAPCPRRTWSETSAAIRARAVLTERARAECARRAGQDATDVARVATDLGVSWGTVMRAVREYGQRILDSQWLHTEVAALGLDETAFLAATPTTPTRLVTGLVDLRRPAAGRPGCSTSSRAAPEGSSATGSTNGVRTGARGCGSRRWTRSAGTRSRCARRCRRRPWCSTPSTRCAWPRTRSTRCAGGCSRRRPATAAARAIRSTASAGCCAAAPSP